MTIPIQPVIMCGGSGTRLWPLSRAGFPKQFLALTGNESLFQQAARRLTALAGEDMPVAAPLIVGNEEHRFLMLEQLREVAIDPAAALLEPVGRNTAPALTLAALAALEGGRDPILVVTPADWHHPILAPQYGGNQQPCGGIDCCPDPGPPMLFFEVFGTARTFLFLRFLSRICG